jgi:rubrerythrin
MIFNAHDIVEFAVRIEEEGEQFYRQAAEKTDNKEVKDLFARLADDEVGHKKIFGRMMKDLPDYQPAETYEGEYLAYVRNYIDGKVVFAGLSDPAAFTTLAAIDYAMQKEIDSVLYYHEIKSLAAPTHHATIDKIIAEERKHFARLAEVRKGYENAR